MIDQDDEGLCLDEFVHHLLKHEVRQQQQDAPQKIIEPTADQHQAILCAGPKKHTKTNVTAHERLHQPNNTKKVKYRQSVEFNITRRNKLNLSRKYKSLS